MASPSRTFQRGVSLLVVIAAVALFVNGYLYQTRKPHLGELLARNHEKTIIATYDAREMAVDALKNTA
ncbi:hypothetical protein PTSG_12758 [Salpingoeca rosetta]|uniref:Uncharacterized protein n=1 Tax=Salpingoeca rosetta (strain ATCC 50818 / BSB-021) TaxID=946362 RepID=F2UK44_SALR5|nr:uncharacterized protein PTSG_12758 [Salpingoeca rosetta]EGD77493.1 hypothetical protein PTSG_12758 [Salpingoeca rosetta]|eukprot:XP_004990381.1 hypothetical protein PTSG_12758 [Salpingoeca rosetta]